MDKEYNEDFHIVYTRMKALGYFQSRAVHFGESYLLHICVVARHLRRCERIDIDGVEYISLIEGYKHLDTHYIKQAIEKKIHDLNIDLSVSDLISRLSDISDTV